MSTTTTIDEPATTIDGLAAYATKLEDVVYHVQKDWRGEAQRLAIGRKLAKHRDEAGTVLRALFEGGDHATLWSLLDGVSYDAIVPMGEITRYGGLPDELLNIDTPIRTRSNGSTLFLYRLRTDED